MVNRALKYGNQLVRWSSYIQPWKHKSYNYNENFDFSWFTFELKSRKLKNIEKKVKWNTIRKCGHVRFKIFKMLRIKLRSSEILKCGLAEVQKFRMEVSVSHPRRLYRCSRLRIYVSTFGPRNFQSLILWSFTWFRDKGGFLKGYNVGRVKKFIDLSLTSEQQFGSICES